MIVILQESSFQDELIKFLFNYYIQDYRDMAQLAEINLYAQGYISILHEWICMLASRK